MASEYKTYDVRSFREFQDIILDIPIENFVLYRGQPQDKALLPKIARYDPSNVEEIERDMLEDFQSRSLHLIDYHPGNSWDWLALAQHHGIPQRAVAFRGKIHGDQDSLNVQWRRGDLSDNRFPLMVG